MDENLPLNEYVNHHKGSYDQFYKESLENPEKFWQEHSKIIDWYRDFDQVLDQSSAPFYRWFTNGKLNVSYNALDRHVKSFRRNKAAGFMGSPTDPRILSDERSYFFG